MCLQRRFTQALNDLEQLDDWLDQVIVANSLVEIRLLVTSKPNN